MRFRKDTSMGVPGTEVAAAISSLEPHARLDPDRVPCVVVVPDHPKPQGHRSSDVPPIVSCLRYVMGSGLHLYPDVLTGVPSRNTGTPWPPAIPA